MPPPSPCRRWPPWMDGWRCLWSCKLGRRSWTLRFAAAASERGVLCSSLVGSRRVLIMELCWPFARLPFVVSDLIIFVTARLSRSREAERWPLTLHCFDPLAKHD
jgi:hypothetical protein